MAFLDGAERASPDVLDELTALLKEAFSPCSRSWDSCAVWSRGFCRLGSMHGWQPDGGPLR
jgi:hypothetical protein